MLARGSISIRMIKCHPGWSVIQICEQFWYMLYYIKFTFLEDYLLLKFLPISTSSFLFDSWWPCNKHTPFIIFAPLFFHTIVSFVISCFFSVCLLLITLLNCISVLYCLIKTLSYFLYFQRSTFIYQRTIELTYNSVLFCFYWKQLPHVHSSTFKYSEQG